MTDTATATARQPAFDRLPTLTGMRWAAAFLVFGFHTGTLGVLGHGAFSTGWSRVFGLGASGVSFFYVLSGFVLVWAARPGERPWTFWRRRAAKIYPNHVTTWLLTILIMLAWGDQVGLRPAVTNVLLIQNWFPPYAYSINNVSWSLSCEMFFYFCLPFALPLLRRAGTRTLVVALLALPVVIALMVPLGNHLPLNLQWWFGQLFPPSRSLEFWLGAVAGELVVRGRWRGPRLGVATVLFLAIYALNSTVIPAQYWLGDMSIFFAVAIAAGATADLRGTRSGWRHPVLVWLGEVSFAFYLVHVQLIVQVERLAHRSGTGWSGVAGYLVLPLLFAACLTAAALLYRFVERPMLRLLGPRRRRPATGHPEVAVAPHQPTSPEAAPAEQAPAPTH